MRSWVLRFVIWCRPWQATTLETLHVLSCFGDFAALKRRLITSAVVTASQQGEDSRFRLQRGFVHSIVQHRVKTY